MRIVEHPPFYSDVWQEWFLDTMAHDAPDGLTYIARNVITGPNDPAVDRCREEQKRVLLRKLS